MGALPKIFCAVDTPCLDLALEIVRDVSVAGIGTKLGMEFFNAQGPQGVKAVMDQAPNVPVFLDLKYHDIPNTVAGAMRSIAPLEVAFANVHASGGLDMMKAAKSASIEEAERLGVVAPKLLAVTILTALDQQAIEAIGYQGTVADQVERLAVLTKEAGLDGVVCSAHEIGIVRKACGADFITMVPGIRPVVEGASADDQKRVMAPQEALSVGAHHLVIGRPITKAKDRGAAAQAIVKGL